MAGVIGTLNELEARPEGFVVGLPPATKGSGEEEAPDGGAGGDKGFVPVDEGEAGVLLPTGGPGGGLAKAVAAGEEEPAGTV